MVVSLYAWLQNYLKLNLFICHGVLNFTSSKEGLIHSKPWCFPSLKRPNEIFEIKNQLWLICKCTIEHLNWWIFIEGHFENNLMITKKLTLKHMEAVYKYSLKKQKKRSFSKKFSAKQRETIHVSIKRKWK